MLTPLPTRPRVALQAVSRISIVASRYNPEFVDPMVEKALAEIRAIEPEAQTEVVYAPGAFEIPFLAKQLIDRRKPNAVLCIGVILQGETAHADLIAASVSDTLCHLSVDSATPMINAVLLLRDPSQARERCLGDAKNRGIEAARAAIEVLRAAKAITAR